MDRKTSSKVLFCCFSLILLLCGGCLRVAPKKPQLIASPAVSYTPNDLDADVKVYRDAVSAGKLTNARLKRDQIVYRVLAQIDAAYGSFELGLSTRRAGYHTASDAVQLGLTAAATVSGTTEVKDILTATATAFQGASLSFDKNFFEEKTTEALLSQMRASRTTLQARMVRSLSNRDVKSYPLESAWADLVSYYYAGTIPSALVDIATKAGNDAAKASEDLKAAVSELTPATPEQAHQAITIRTEYQKLSAAIVSGDSAKAQAAGVTLRQILDAAQVHYDPTAQPGELLAVLGKAMVAAADDDALLKKLNAAVQLIAKEE